MDNKQSAQTLYSFIYAYEMTKHNKNIRRIKLAIRYFFIIPMIMLAVMLLTGSSNIVFLMLWIVSLFSIAAYAIVIEYNDYELQKRMHIMEQLESGDTVDMDGLDVLPLIKDNELEKIGFDRDSTREAISIFNRQKRKERIASKKAQAEPQTDGSAAKAPEDSPAADIASEGGDGQ